MKYEVGTHQFRKGFDCLECAEVFYNELEGKKYLLNKDKNVLILNNYGWKNG